MYHHHHVPSSKSKSKLNLTPSSTGFLIPQFYWAAPLTNTVVAVTYLCSRDWRHLRLQNSRPLAVWEVAPVYTAASHSDLSSPCICVSSNLSVLSIHVGEAVVYDDDYNTTLKQFCKLTMAGILENT